MTDYAPLLFANLKRGRDGAQSLSALSEGMGVARRSLEQAVQDLRRREYPVCSGSEGVWIAETAADLDGTLGNLRSRLRQQYATYAAVKRVQGRLRAIEDRGEVEQLWLDMEAA